MKDRVSLYPGRIRLIPVEGQDNVYDLVRADEPIEEGTPLNKVNLLKDSTIQKYVNANINVPDDVFNYLGNYAEYWWKRINAGIVSYVHSTDRTAYPDTGELNGFSYEYVGIPFENMPNMPVKIETGSYVGTGAVGSSNPNSLTFSFVPKLVMFTKVTDSNNVEYNSGYFLSSNNPCPVVFDLTNLSNIFTKSYMGAREIYCKLNDKTFSWYYNSTSNPGYQLNASKYTYHYVAIG